MIPVIVKLYESPSRAGGLLMINYPSFFPATDPLPQNIVGYRYTLMVFIAQKSGNDNSC